MHTCYVKAICCFYDYKDPIYPKNTITKFTGTALGAPFSTQMNSNVLQFTLPESLQYTAEKWEILRKTENCKIWQ